MASIRDSFIFYMHQDGLETGDTIIADGRLHRFHVLEDRKGTKNGWYILYPDFPAVGIFGCWKRNIKRKWQQYMDKYLTVSDLRKVHERFQCMQYRSDHEFKTDNEALRTSATIWQNAKPASDSHG